MEQNKITWLESSYMILLYVNESAMHPCQRAVRGSLSMKDKYGKCIPIMVLATMEFLSPQD